MKKADGTRIVTDSRWRMADSNSNDNSVDIEINSPPPPQVASTVADSLMAASSVRPTVASSQQVLLRAGSSKMNQQLYTIEAILGLNKQKEQQQQQGKT